MQQLLGGFRRLGAVLRGVLAPAVLVEVAARLVQSVCGQLIGACCMAHLGRRFVWHPCRSLTVLAEASQCSPGSRLLRGLCSTQQRPAAGMPAANLLGALAR